MEDCAVLSYYYSISLFFSIFVCFEQNCYLFSRYFPNLFGRKSTRCLRPSRANSNAMQALFSSEKSSSPHSIGRQNDVNI